MILIIIIIRNCCSMIIFVCLRQRDSHAQKEVKFHNICDFVGFLLLLLLLFRYLFYYRLIIEFFIYVII